MAAKKTYGIGAIGLGVIWRLGHWPGIKTIPREVQVRRVHDTNTQLMTEVAKETEARAAEKADEIFEAPDVDIVCLATPPFARVDYVEKACAAGKHLMIEKPMARTTEDAVRIFDLVRAAGIKCFVPFARAVNHAFRELVDGVRSGELGEPVAFSHLNLGTPYPWVGLDHWMHVQELSGGPLFDFSIHFIEMARACMMSEAKSVYCGGAGVTGRVASDDHATLLVEYESGGFGNFTKSWSFPPGSKVGHVADHLICQEGIAVIGIGGIEIHPVKGEARKIELNQQRNGRAEAYQNLIAAIERDEPLYASEIEGLRTVEVLCAGLKSRETGRREPVPRHR